MFFSYFWSKRKYLNSGFTLLEMIIVIFVIIVGVIGVFSLIIYTLSLSIASSQRLIAAYLGQEGIEIVRNIRDENWLEQGENPSLNWKDGLAEGNWEADYNDLSLTTFVDPGRFLKIDSNSGFYNYDGGVETPFKRKITISYLEDNALRVSVYIQWQEKGRDNQIIVEEILYNWKL